MKFDGGVQERGDTRTAVARIVLENGPQTAAALGERLNLSPAAIRRHLDALVADGLLVERDPAKAALGRGRGRPARAYAITDAGRAAFPHGYDDLATTALRYLREAGGDTAVEAFAEHRARELEHRLRDSAGPPATLQVLAGRLSAEGYPADVRESATPAGPSVGAQLCQHHCPVAHVAAEFPQLCAAETRMFERVLGTYVQRLATIGHGDGVCTTHVPQPREKRAP
ncbi:helix-turn-helix transcriptional regulator [Jatrophihabitans sp. YIM 134969]